MSKCRVEVEELDHDRSSKEMNYALKPMLVELIQSYGPSLLSARARAYVIDVVSDDSDAYLEKAFSDMEKAKGLFEAAYDAAVESFFVEYYDDIATFFGDES